MSERILTPAEASTLLTSLSRQMEHVQASMASAADDREMGRLRALIGDYDVCYALARLVRGGHFRVTGPSGVEHP